MKTKRLSAGLMLGASLVSHALAQGTGASFSDFLASRGIISGYTNTVVASSSSYSHEPGEPAHVAGSGTRSAWLMWIAPASGVATMDTFGSDFDTVLAVYTGDSFATLSVVAANDDTPPGLQSRVVFNAAAGAAYNVVVDGYAADTGGVIFFHQLLEAPPRITTEPADTSAVAGTGATFSTLASGTPPLSYQWRVDGAPIPGANGASYTETFVLPASASAALASGYDVVVTNSFGATTSLVARLNVSIPPYITAQPQAQTVAPGQSATLNVVAIGSEPLNYQWRLNGTPLTSASAVFPSNTVFSAQWADAGYYDVVVANGAGSVTSLVARLSVNDPNQPALSVPSAVVVPCTGPAGATVAFNVSAGDPYDPAPIVICRPASGSVFPIGSTTVSCVAVDRFENLTRAQFTVRVSGRCDEGYIAVHCPSNIQVNLGSLSTVPVSFVAAATNLFTGQPYPVQCSPPSGTLFPRGVNTVTCIASAGGASNVCTFAVTVNDVTAPDVRAPASIVVSSRVTNAVGQAGAYVNFAATAADNVGVVLSYDPPPGSFFPAGTNIVSCIARDAAGNQTTTTFRIVVGYAPTGLDWNADNWGFENPLLTGWSGTGAAFADQPVAGDYLTVKRIPKLQQEMQARLGGDYWPDLYYPAGHKGQRWICTAYQPHIGPGGNLDDLFSEALMGTLLSKRFVIQNAYISFLIGGTRDAGRLRVELLIEAPAGTPGATNVIQGRNYYVFDSRTGHDLESMRRDGWWVATQQGKLAYICIVDQSTTGHLNVDDFQFQGVAPSDDTFTVGGSSHPAVVVLDGFHYDWDSAVWGFADMHAHPMSYLGFGQKLMHGLPDGGPGNPADFATGLANCKCDHGGFGVDNPCGDYFRQLVMHFTDNGGPSPHDEGWDANPWKEFRNWPVFSTVAHQQMWFDWIKRAHDGGQRVMVALCVNNRLLATASKGDPTAPHHDKAVGDLQITKLKEFVARHTDFIEIAYDPFQLRDIVRRDKLAIIIGSELDDIGDLVKDQTVTDYKPDAEFGGEIDEHSKSAVRTEIQRLYDQGLRYIFPVHLADNKFGGTAPGADELNFASKFLNGFGFQVQWAAPADHIHFWLSSEDFTTMIPRLSDGDRLAIADLIIFAGPLLTAIEPALEGLLPDLAPAPPGTGGAAAFGLLPIVAAVVLAEGTDGLLRSLLTLAGLTPGDVDEIVNARILPLPGMYPQYPDQAQAKFGVRNGRGLTDLGAFAVKEMMRRGMMIDVDHMSQKTLDSVLDLATQVPTGYPLNFGHNGFRDLGPDGMGSENNRSAAQLTRLVPLGGLMGVGWENAKDGSFGSSFSEKVPNPISSSSRIENNCAGTCRTFGQAYLYALEQLGGRNVALGTDASGFIQAPGPRFGPQSAYGLGPASDGTRHSQVKSQANGVLYEPRVGRALTTPAFRGRAIDPGNQDQDAAIDRGYAYNEDQADFFAAISIFDWEKASVEGGKSLETLQNELKVIQDALSDNYPESHYGFFEDGSKRRIVTYALGLLEGIKDWAPGGDNLATDVGPRQLLGKSVYRVRVAGLNALDEVVFAQGGAYLPRFGRLLNVWDDYQNVFGRNAPLKRCQTDLKQWDINFEGVAHYGLIPDFLQDLTNVGLQPPDLSVLFRSAEDFAQMWTRCLEGADAFKPHFSDKILPGGNNELLLSFTPADEGFQIEESPDLRDPSSWRAADLLAATTNGLTVTIRVPVPAQPKFYRLHKP